MVNFTVVILQSGVGIKELPRAASGLWRVL